MCSSDLIDALKADFSKFRKNRTPAYRERVSKKELSSKKSDRLTIVEEDLLFVLLHDDRLASPLANTLDISWVDSRPAAGRILAKILSETIAENTCPNLAQIQDLLEDDDERDLYNHLLMQEIDQTDPGLFLRLARQCVSVLFMRHLKKEEESLFDQLKDTEDNPDTLKKLSEKLRSIRHQRNSPPLLEI